MSRNENMRFVLNPTSIDKQRSSFGRNSSHKTSFNVGDLIPFYVDEVLPGDTFNVKTSKVVRLQTLITPMMDNMYLDTYYFFVPNRLVWSHWREFMGENTESAWIPETEYSVPQLEAPASTGWLTGTIADYMGIRPGIAGLEVNALPFRAYAKIVDDWFRDQNLQDPINIPLTDADVTGTNGTDYVDDLAKGGYPFKAAKYHDYFTSALPSPQKGPEVTIPVAEAANLPVMPLSDVRTVGTGESPMKYFDIATGAAPTAALSFQVGTDGVVGTQATSSTKTNQLTPVNLWAVQTGSASAATINDLRIAFQIQKFYEANARGGSRYIELLKTHFGVTSPDSRLQRSEYLGGNRIPIHVNQVIQQSSSDATSPQGNVAGQSLTVDFNSDFTRSFTEHGFVIGVMVARYDHTYQQGVERFWNRKSKFDYYWPLFANIGEQAILNKEIYCQGPAVVDSDGEIIDDQVFGYQEAWADYRYKPNRVSGEMRSDYTAPLDMWHLGDDYSSLPYLSETWIMEDKSNVDRVLAVTSAVSNQLFADIYVQNRTTRCMPLYSIPGLIDHH